MSLEIVLLLDKRLRLSK